MSVQDILLQQALQDSQNQPDPSVAMAVGGAGGAALGALAMAPAHYVGAGINSVKDNLAARQGLSRSMAQRMRGSIRPGFRAAGGLVGLMAGGALGAGVANAFRSSSDAGNMLAKIQATNGNLTAMDQIELQQILADSYNNMGR